MTKLIELIMDNAAIEEIKADLYDNLHEEDYVNQQDPYCGDTALHYACKNNYTEAIKVLLAHPKIDINKINIFVKTPLDFITEHYPKNISLFGKHIQNIVDKNLILLVNGKKYKLTQI